MVDRLWNLIAKKEKKAPVTLVAQKYIELLPVIKFWGEGEREGGQEQEVKYIAFVQFLSAASFL